MFKNETLIEEIDHLKKFALRLTRNPSDAEDLLQATLLRTFEKKHLFQEGTNLFGWASKIMFNIFVSGYRRRQKFETQYDPETFIDSRSVPADQDGQMEWEDVKTAINSLSASHQEILTMVCVHGMEYVEVAELLNVPVGTVRSRLSRARENLQLALDNGVAGQGAAFMQRAMNHGPIALAA
jgi:RNA polymerase sigma-70 factor (ECF subfamily)